MFCTKCGSELPDGAKFCTNCGAQVTFVTAPPPAAPAAPAQPVVSAAPVQPAAPAMPAQPAAPAPQQAQPGAWQQPRPTQPGSWQQPQPAQPGSWQQQPQQWQPIQQQWQSRQQPQQPTRQQQPQWQQQPPQWQPAGGSAPAQPKKKGKGWLIGVIAAVLIAAVGVGGFVWPGFFKGGKTSAAIPTALAERFSTPEEFYRAAETKNAAELAGHLSNVYDNLFLSNAASDDVSVAGTLKIEPGDKLRGLLLDVIGPQLDQLNPGDDLSWLKAVSLVYDVSRKDDLGMLNAGVQLNGTDLAHVNAVLRIEDGVLCLSVPELSDKYLELPLEDLDLDSFSLPSGLTGLSPEDAEKIGPVVEALLDAKTVETILNRYLSEAIGQIEDVEKESGTLTAEGVSADYTVLTATVTPDTAVRIVEKLGPELKEDKDIKKIILDVAAASGQDGEAKYKEFTDKIDEKLNDTAKIRENMKDNLVLTVYLDKNGDAHGRVIDSGSRKLELLMPENDGQFGLTIRCTQDGEETLLLSGSGKRSGDKLTGDLDLTVGGEYYAVLGLDGFDVEKVKDGYLSGAVDVKPTASFWKKVTGGADDGTSALPESLKSILDSLTVRLELNTAKDKSAVTLTLLTGGDKLISIAADGAKSSAKPIAAADGVEPDEWAGDITLDKLEKVVAAIEKAGVPAAYTDFLDEALDSAFN